jgi:endonuclease/exonuclease/phosphatase family metal-dependent hydrolase
MAARVYQGIGSLLFKTLAILVLLSGAAHAQTTLTLQATDDATLQGGVYENTNFANGDLVTRASDDETWIRHAVLKFDTHNTIPAGSQIVSATLTLAVKGGNTESRTVSAYCVHEGFLQRETTWRKRYGSYYWSSPGGTGTHQHATAGVPGTVNSRVSFNVTAAVQEALGKSQRYTRLLLADTGAASKGSLRYYHSRESSSTSLRPTLQVTYGSSATTDPTASSGSGSTTSSTLKVLEFNIHQGYGTDGKSNIDRVVNWIVKLQPQLIAFNEIMKYSTNNQPQMIIDRLKARTGQSWYYHWAQKWGATSGEGVAVVSRYPFQDTDTYLLSYNRSVALARVEVNGRMVNMAATHLDAASSSYRLTQVKQLKSYLSMFAQQRIVAGDFNGWPGTSEINEMSKDYYDAWAVAKSKGTAISSASNPDGNTRNTRIDYIFYSKLASALSLVSTQVVDTKADGTSDHRAVLATFKVN